MQMIVTPIFVAISFIYQLHQARIHRTEFWQLRVITAAIAILPFIVMRTRLDVCFLAANIALHILPFKVISSWASCRHENFFERREELRSENSVGWMSSLLLPSSWMADFKRKQVEINRQREEINRMSEELKRKQEELRQRQEEAERKMRENANLNAGECRPVVKEQDQTPRDFQEVPWKMFENRLRFEGELSIQNLKTVAEEINMSGDNKEFRKIFGFARNSNLSDLKKRRDKLVKALHADKLEKLKIDPESELGKAVFDACKNINHAYKQIARS